MDIVLCHLCKGSNIFEQETCPACNGNGRVLQKNYTLRLPFNMPLHLQAEADKKIIAILKEIEQCKKNVVF